VLPVAVDPDAGRSFLEAVVRACARTYGPIHLTGGLERRWAAVRKALNEVFIDLALEAGVDSAIVDPVAPWRPRAGPLHRLYCAADAPPDATVPRLPDGLPRRLAGDRPDLSDGAGTGSAGVRRLGAPSSHAWTVRCPGATTRSPRPAAVDRRAYEYIAEQRSNVQPAASCCANDRDRPPSGVDEPPDRSGGATAERLIR
jgi:hypothetical protein